VISPWAKVNAVDHTLVDTTSILRFIEDRFGGGQRIGGGSLVRRWVRLPSVRLSIGICDGGLASAHCAFLVAGSKMVVLSEKRVSLAVLAPRRSGG
jgi:hypothetical protein